MGAITPKEDYTNIPHQTFDAVIVAVFAYAIWAIQIFWAN